MSQFDRDYLDEKLDTAIPDSPVSRSINSMVRGMLSYIGAVTTYTNTTTFASTELTGYGNDFFNNWFVFVLWDADGASAAPQGELQPISDYVSSTGTFTHTAFTTPVAATDKVMIVHKDLAAIGGMTTGAATGAPTTTDSIMAYIKQIVNNTYKLAEAADGTDVFPASVAEDSLFAKILSKSATPVASSYSNVTDSMEMLSDKIGAFTGDGGVDADDSVKALCDLLNTAVTAIKVSTDLLNTELTQRNVAKSATASSISNVFADVISITDKGVLTGIHQSLQYTTAATTGILKVIIDGTTVIDSWATTITLDATGTLKDRFTISFNHRFNTSLQIQHRVTDNNAGNILTYVSYTID